MTLSERSKPRPTEGDPCPSCPPENPGELVSRPAYPYPIFTQIAFGLSFVLFLIFIDHLRTHRIWIWSWTAFQIGLGLLLVLQRLRARKRILHCIRCGLDLR